MAVTATELVCVLKRAAHTRSDTQADARPLSNGFEGGSL